MAGRSDIALRIGTTERDGAAADLGEHYSAGRLSAEEFEERVRLAYEARTAADLAPLFADLPPLRQPAAPRRPRDLRPLLLLAVVAGVIAWVAVLHVPPFFLFPLMWIFFSGRRFGRRRFAHYR